MTAPAPVYHTFPGDPNERPPPYAPGNFQPQDQYAPPAGFKPPQEMSYDTYSQGQPIGAVPAFGGYPPAPEFNHQRTTVITLPAPAQPTTVIYAGGCPNCRGGFLNKEFTCCGILLAIVCFPIGLICCLAMTHQRCTNCGATFS